jgi:hypothetical protein
MTVIPSIKEPKFDKNDKLLEEVSRLEDLKGAVVKLEREYFTMFPKVSPRLIKDVLNMQTQNPNKIPMFTLEVFTKKGGEGGIDCDTIREHIWNTTGKMPAIYDNGTHYVTNQGLTLETLKKLNDFEHVLKVTGEYSGNCYTSHVPTHGCSMELEEIQKKEKENLLPRAEKKTKEKISVLKAVIFTIVGIAGSVAIGGFVVSGGILPNAHTNDVVLASPLGQEPGMLFGYVGGPVVGLPAIGASVIAANQEIGYTANSVISIDGRYYLDLVPGKYNIIVAFPDGTSQSYNDVAIKRGTASEMNLMYQ